jgi:hypothetical protein
VLVAVQQDVTAASSGSLPKHGAAQLEQRLSSLRGTRLKGDMDVQLTSVIAQVGQLEDRAGRLAKVIVARTHTDDMGE